MKRKRDPGCDLTLEERSATQHRRQAHLLDVESRRCRLSNRSDSGAKTTDLTRGAKFEACDQTPDVIAGVSTLAPPGLNFYRFPKRSDLHQLLFLAFLRFRSAENAYRDMHTGLSYEPGQVSASYDLQQIYRVL